MREALRPRTGGLELFQPAHKRRFTRLAFPLPGDRTQKLITPNVFRLARQFQRLRPHLVIAVTPGPFGFAGMYLAGHYRTGFITAFHTHFEGLVKMYGDTPFFRFAFLLIATATASGLPHSGQPMPPAGPRGLVGMSISLQVSPAQHVQGIAPFVGILVRLGDSR